MVRACQDGQAAVLGARLMPLALLSFTVCGHLPGTLAVLPLKHLCPRFHTAVCFLKSWGCLKGVLCRCWHQQSWGCHTPR